jgi:hypothetical protein
MSFLFAGRWNLLCGVVLILFSSMAWFAQTFTAGTQDGSRGSGRFGQTMECWTGYKTTIKDWPAITTTPDKLFLTGVSGSVPRFASLKTCAVEYVGFLLIQRTGKHTEGIRLRLRLPHRGCCATYAFGQRGYCSASESRRSPTLWSCLTSRRSAIEDMCTQPYLRA